MNAKNAILAVVVLASVCVRLAPAQDNEPFGNDFTWPEKRPDVPRLIALLERECRRSGNINAWRNLADVKWKSGDIEGSLKLATESLPSWDIYIRYRQLARDRGEFRKPHEDWPAIEKFELECSYVVPLLERGRIDEALAIANRADPTDLLRSQTDDSLYQWSDMVIALWDGERRDEVRQCIRRTAKALDRSSPDAVHSVWKMIAGLSERGCGELGTLRPMVLQAAESPIGDERSRAKIIACWRLLAKIDYAGGDDIRCRQSLGKGMEIAASVEPAIAEPKRLNRQRFEYVRQLSHLLDAAFACNQSQLGDDLAQRMRETAAGMTSGFQQRIAFQLAFFKMAQRDISRVERLIDNLDPKGEERTAAVHALVEQYKILRDFEHARYYLSLELAAADQASVDDRFVTLWSLAEIETKSGRAPLAREYVDQMIQLAPQLENPDDLLNQALTSLGFFDDAYEWLRASKYPYRVLLLGRMVEAVATAEAAKRGQGIGR